MPYCSIPTEKLEFLSLFGFRVIGENDDFYFIIDSRGDAIVDKKKPFIWFDDVADAMQMGAESIMYDSHNH